jgi:hypothetical protein
VPGATEISDTRELEIDKAQDLCWKHLVFYSSHSASQRRGRQMSKNEAEGVTVNVSAQSNGYIERIRQLYPGMVSK